MNKAQKERLKTLKIRNEIMEITITGRIPSKKNSKQIVCRGKYPKVLPSAKYKEWHIDATRQLVELEVPRNSIQTCEIEMQIFFPDNRCADLTNKAESVMDLLVDHGIIEDDKWQCVNKVTLEGWKDKENPRAVINVIT